MQYLEGKDLFTEDNSADRQQGSLVAIASSQGTAQSAKLKARQMQATWVTTSRERTI
jgi:hypothetical protein